MKWSTACLDWEKRLIAKQSLIPFKPLFPSEARSALAVFNELRIVDAPGSPFMGDMARPWVKDFVGAIFGAYDVELGKRYITEFLLLISKKNGKSSTAAMIMLTALIRNWRESAEFLILAPTVEIANNSYYPARDAVRRDPELSTLFHVQDHVRTITHRKNGASLKIIAAENEAVSGKKATGVLIDELWLFGKRPEAENMLREATGGLASRPEGFTIYLSTQSDTTPAGIWRQKLHYARGVRDGRIVDNRFLPVLYEFPVAMVERKEYLLNKNFYITNPNLELSVSQDFLDHELAKSKEGGGKSMQGFLAKHLNIEIGLNLMSDNWVGAEFWKVQTIPAFTLEDLLEACEVVDVGIDGGGLDDLLGLAVLGRTASKRWMLWTHAWAHPSVMQRRQDIAPRLRDFEGQGDLTVVERIGDDVDAVANIVSTIEKRGLLDKVGCDPSGIGAILDALVAVDIPQEKVVGITQGWRMHAAIKTAERKLADRTLVHGGQELMTWCVGNAKVVPVGNAIVITKQASGTAKIDPLMASFNAVNLMALNPLPSQPKFQVLFM